MRLVGSLQDFLLKKVENNFYSIRIQIIIYITIKFFLKNEYMWLTSKVTDIPT